jgi:hypothetical protein
LGGCRDRKGERRNDRQRRIKEKASKECRLKNESIKQKTVQCRAPDRRVTDGGMGIHIVSLRLATTGEYDDGE